MRLQNNIKLDNTISLAKDNNILLITGPLGTLCQKVDKELIITINKGKKAIRIEHANKSIRQTQISLFLNYLEGVRSGFYSSLFFHGVLYTYSVLNGRFILLLGKSHSISLNIPKRITVSKQIDKVITFYSIDKQALHLFTTYVYGRAPFSKLKKIGLIVKHKNV